jgi:hypothetical protein
MTYAPLGRPEKRYFPIASVVVDREVAPDKVNVAAEPLTPPEMVYVMDGFGVGAVAGLKTTSTQ